MALLKSNKLPALAAHIRDEKCITLVTAWPRGHTHLEEECRVVCWGSCKLESSTGGGWNQPMVCSVSQGLEGHQWQGSTEINLYPPG